LAADGVTAVFTACAPVDYPLRGSSLNPRLVAVSMLGVIVWPFKVFLIPYGFGKSTVVYGATEGV
jgi:hypothetical protein